jgi:antitoxin YefM
MNIKTTLPISEARKKIFEIANKVQKPGNYYTVTEKGRPKAIIMSAEEFESWQETIEVAQKFPDLKKDIATAEAEIKRGDYITMEEMMVKDGYILADKPKQKYGVSNNNIPKR